MQRNHKAFKEWAVVVDALGQGRQIVVFRKGGIAEGPGGFDVEEREFFLFPTYEHQNKDELIPEVHPRLDELVKRKPRDGKVHLQFYATVQAVHRVTDLEMLYRLEGHHIWTKQLVEERFHWGSEQGLHVLILRVFRLPLEMSVPYKSDYGGCKSWVDFGENHSTEGTTVLSNAEFHQEMNALQKLLR